MEEVLYVHDEKVHNKRAANLVLPVLFKYYKPKSVLDVGCGIGTWLSDLHKFGIFDYLGVDGDYVNREQLKIPESKFMPFDLTTPLKIDRKFDLVISLEVAEHLPEQAADTFVKTLVSHGDVILFSAALPGQEGQNHLNEQWPRYWRAKFKKHGFEFTNFLRDEIWDNDVVEYFYRQNIFVAYHTNKINSLPRNSKGLSRIHPHLWNHHLKSSKKNINRLNERVENLESGKIGIKWAFQILLKAIKVKLFK
jgi:SAM-dependent methyltransferase